MRNIISLLLLFIYRKYFRISCMYSVVSIAGKQFKVTTGQKFVVPKLDNEIGDTVVFDKVLLADEDGKITVGTPFISKAAVHCKVEDQVKDVKVLVFKKKRRKGYARRRGHRQKYTELVVESITLK